VQVIVVAQKPWGKKRIDDIVRTGAGALNVDKARISGSWKWGTQTDITGGGYGSKRPSDGNILARNVESHPRGRWPSNFALCHVPPDAEGKGGCERVGVRKVRGSHSMGNCEGKDYGLKNSPIYQDDVGRVAGQDHVDPDGYERVDDWRCVEGCVVRRLGEQSDKQGLGRCHNVQPTRRTRRRTDAHEAVRDLIERYESRVLDRGMEVGRFNQRGDLYDAYADDELMFASSIVGWLRGEEDSVYD